MGLNQPAVIPSDSCHKLPVLWNLLKVPSTHLVVADFANKDIAKTLSVMSLTVCISSLCTAKITKKQHICLGKRLKYLIRNYGKLEMTFVLQCALSLPFLYAGGIDIDQQ